MEPIKVGLLGFGTVGSGTFTVLGRNQEEIKRRAGRGIEVTRIAVRNPAKALAALGGDAGAAQITDDFNSVVDDPSIAIIAEMIGGTGIARELVLRAIANGKHVVTANKALLAVHGTEIFEAARAKGVMVAFEAAVAGGIPIIKALREGLTANRIQYIAGIINGTTNYILSEMRDRGNRLRDRAEGRAGNRLRGSRSDLRHRRRRRRTQGDDHERDRVRRAGAVRARVRRGHQQARRDRHPLRGRTRLPDQAARHHAPRRNGIELRVHPTLIPEKRLLANVEGAMNAVVVHGDAVGTTLYYGKGAGAEPTASAVVADLVDVTRLHTADPEHRVPHLAFQPDSLSNTPILPIEEVTSGYYLRLRVADQTGVLAAITRILAESGISIDALLQKESEQVDDAKGETDIILITHVTVEKNVNAAIAQIESLATVVSKVTKLRMEALN